MFTTIFFSFTFSIVVMVLRNFCYNFFKCKNWFQTFNLIHVPDFEVTKKFYGDIGFQVVWERKPEERKGYMVMRNGDSILNFYCGNEHVYEQPYFKRFPKETSRGYAVEIVIPCDDIKLIYEKVEQNYKENIVEPLMKRFDKLDFRMLDPFGFYLRFVERYDWVNGRDKEGNKLEAK